MPRMTLEERALISSWRWGHITYEQLLARLGVARLSELLRVQKSVESITS